MDYNFHIKAKVWIYEGPNPWYFVTVPKKEASFIRKELLHKHRGWGSIPTEVTIGKSTWKTSIFWEKAGTYLLPIKKSVRAKEGITNGSMISLSLTLLP